MLARLPQYGNYANKTSKIGNYAKIKFYNVETILTKLPQFENYAKNFHNVESMLTKLP